MYKEKISIKQGFCITVLFIIGNALVTGISSEAKQDVWISFFIAMLIMIPFTFLYSKLLTAFPGKDLFDIINVFFGKILGKIFSIMFLWYFFHVGSLVIRHFSDFVNIISFPETPEYIITIFIGLLCIWGSKAGIEVLGRFSIFIVPFVFLVITIVIALSLSRVNFINMKPVLLNGIKPVLSNTLLILSFPLAETIVFTCVFNTLENKGKTYKMLLLSTAISGLILLVISVRNIMILGVGTSSSLFFPSYMAVRTINIGEFLQRFEIVTAVVLVFCVFIKVSILINVVTKGVSKILNIEDKSLLTAPIGLFMMAMSYILFNSTMEMFEWADGIYKYYAMLFQIILPVIILVVVKIRLKLNPNLKEKLK